LPRQVTARFIERRSVLVVIDLEQQIAGFDRCAVGVLLANEVALHTRTNLRVDESFGRSDGFRVDRHVLLSDRSDLDFRGRRRGRRLPLT
jgi:hypothetical protein